MKSLRSTGLMGRLLGILLLVILLDVVLNAFVFERASQFSLQEEDVDSISGRLIVAHRILDQSPPSFRDEVADELTTKHFKVDWGRRVSRPAASLELDALRSQLIDREGDLAATGLRLHLRPIGGGDYIEGTMILSDRSVVTFSAEAHEAFGINFQRAILLLLPTALLTLVGALLVRAALGPLRKLMDATRHVGEQVQPVPLEPSGSQEVRQLIVAFNEMQDRIHQLIQNRQMTISAIAHDLRTPLSRLQMRLDQQADDPAARDAMAADIAEVELLLQSLQTFNEGRDHRSPIERIDLAALAQTLIDDAADRGRDAVYEGLDHLEMSGRRLALRRVITNLIENALHYAGNVRLRLTEVSGEALIEVLDDGPGIEDSQIAEALKPFVRLDAARGRDTPGMGLGLAIVNRIVRAQGGTFELSNRKSGGLRAAIRLPMTGPQ